MSWNIITAQTNYFRVSQLHAIPATSREYIIIVYNLYLKYKQEKKINNICFFI